MLAKRTVDLPRITFHRLIKGIRYRIIRPFIWKRLTLPSLLSSDNTSFFRKVGWTGSPDELLTVFQERARFRFFFHPRNRKDFFLHTLTATQSHDSILEEADLILRNGFQTLGSPIMELGNPIPWHRDFKSGKEWPVTPSNELDILDLGHPSDVKVPWELSRFHQTWWLGKAHWLTGNQAYAGKFTELVSDWIERNPVGSGVNWAIAMEASIRACNWIAGYYFFCESPSFDRTFQVLFFRSLLMHGLFVESHLEYSRVNGNHFLSNVVGLIYLGIFFRDLPIGKRWLRWAIPQLEQAMREQVYEDGVNHEKSTAYHRLVLEFFYSSALLCRHNDIMLSDAFWQRLGRMFEYVEAYTRPDGSIPLIGDADDGRLFRISMNQDINDHRHALSVGAIMFKRPDLNRAAGRFDQEALWYFGGEGFEIHRIIGEVKSPRESRAFPDGGFYIMRDEAMHVFVDAGDIGMRGRGGHGHNDTLSFELWWAGNPVITDSGTYAYTSDPELRNKLRSTRAHNTLIIDDREITDFAGLWSIVSDETRPRVLRWSATPGLVVLEAEHSGYLRLPSPVLHRRLFEMRTKEGYVQIKDILEGSGSHVIEGNLHLGLHLEAKISGKTAHIRLPNGMCRISVSTGTLTERETLFSPSYGVSLQRKTLNMVLKATLPAEIHWEVRFEHAPSE